MYRTDFWTPWEKARVGWSERKALKHIYYQVRNRSPFQVGCMWQVLRADALGRPRGMGWRGRWEGGSGRGTHVNPCLIHVNVWQKPLQCCKVISLQLVKINGGKKMRSFNLSDLSFKPPQSVLRSHKFHQNHSCQYYQGKWHCKIPKSVVSTPLTWMLAAFGTVDYYILGKYLPHLVSWTPCILRFLLEGLSLLHSISFVLLTSRGFSFLWGGKSTP